MSNALMVFWEAGKEHEKFSIPCDLIVTPDSMQLSYTEEWGEFKKRVWSGVNLSLDRPRYELSCGSNRGTGVLKRSLEEGCDFSGPWTESCSVGMWEITFDEPEAA